ncbi:OsmC family protein [Thiopseudomonas denitrificans]|uniref:Putative redox protein n=1 Tax=Thiopseudomonas denitrificans TaxID=1501432 RepID=A0A4R6TQ87_9GAMM|nr:OsmC family protein [Thiopseudomonas denitrificans]TDQ34667.1 putative redox protein [Thiopseudomonas denitrificans]
MQARVKWVEEVLFMGQSGSGHTVMMDGPEEVGGRNLAARPMEMLLMGLGGCSTFDVVSILKKSRQQVESCEVEIRAERADTEPKVFTRIDLHFVVSGQNLKESAVQRAVALSAEKYCSASIMLERAGVAIGHSFSIVGADAAE